MGDLKKTKNVHLYKINSSLETLDIDEEWEFRNYEKIFKEIKRLII